MRKLKLIIMLFAVFLSAPVYAGWTTGGNYTGKVVQTVISQYSAPTIGTTSTASLLIPWDNTRPQITEGCEFMSVSITPTNENNKLFIELITYFASDQGASKIIGAIFKDTTADAIATGVGAPMSVNYLVPFNLSYSTTAGTTDPITFSFRAGGHVGVTATTTMNALNGSSALFDSTLNSFIRVTEIKP